MSESIKRFDVTTSATENFVREYAERMRHPVSHILSVINQSNNPDLSATELETLSRLIKEIDTTLTGLMRNLERDGQA